MKKFYLSILALSALVFGCQKPELADPNENGSQPMKDVAIAAGMGTSETKAALDSETGQFSWQEGDVISVLATDGKFYDFTLSEGTGSWKAEFTGSIPVEAQITTVATYPALTSNATENTLLNETTLNYVLPSEWTWKKDVSNVPMVATFAEGADYMSFKQVGGVMRFPVKNMPAKGTFVLTMPETHFTGEFPIDITKLGETAMLAGGAPKTKSDDGMKDVVIEVLPEVYTETLTITYDSEFYGELVEFNVPVPTGTYKDFYLQVKDEQGTVIYEKKYVKDNVVERATLLNMSQIELPKTNMPDPEVWPYFVDARVVLPEVVEGETQYAVYVDGAAEPVLKDIEMVGEKATVVIGGDFAHNSTHTVAIAKVVNGDILTETRSDEVEFTTANIFQMTKNTGTKFVTVGWDDVALGWGPKYDGEKWSAVPKSLNTDGTSVHYKRGYQVQLLAADKTTVLYDLIPFAGHEAFTGLFSDSSWLGKVSDQNILIPTALSFGYLTPGQDYYFRVKTLEGTEYIGLDKGNHNPEDNGSYPFPYPIYSDRGGSAWSELVKLSTDPEHIPSQYEVLYQGFDDHMTNNDYMNWAPGVVPDVTSVRQSWDDYTAAYAEGYETFLGQTHAQRKWTSMAFSKMLTVESMGIIDPWQEGVERVFNEKAGSLKGWSLVSTSKVARTVYTDFGTIRLGQSGSSTSSPVLSSPALQSANLSDDTPKLCRITTNIGFTATSQTVVPTTLYVSVYREAVEDGQKVLAKVGESIGLSPEIQHKEEWEAWFNPTHVDSKNYAHHQRFFELTCEVELKNGDVLKFDRPSLGKGLLIIGDIKIEALADVVEEPEFSDNGVGTEPDNTNYDVYGLGKMPISYWWTIPDYAHNYDDAKTRELYADMAASGINIVLHNGEVNFSVEENKRIMNIAKDLGMKFISQYWTLDPKDRLSVIEEHFASSPNYIGEYLSDEPGASKYDELGDFVTAFNAKFPDKEAYINLYPIYARPTSLGTSTYAEYIDQYIAKVPTKSISYDYYGLNAEPQSLGSTYYTNLDLVRSKSLAVRKPFWMITQAGKVGKNTRMPSEKEERWNVWSMLAAGSKGVSYFCYWDPWSSEEDPDADVAMIHRDGEKTDRYYWIKQINSDIETIGKKLLPCHADGIILTHPTYYPLYDNDGLGRTNYGPVKAVSGNTSIGLGCFRDARVSENGDNYKGYKVMTVSQMPCRDAEAWLTLDPSVTEITVTHIHTSETLQVNNSLNATVGGITVSFDGTKLIVSMPEGEAALIEF